MCFRNLVPTYKPAWRCNPEDHHRHFGSNNLRRSRPFSHIIRLYDNLLLCGKLLTYKINSDTVALFIGSLQPCLATSLNGGLCKWRVMVPLVGMAFRKIVVGIVLPFVALTVSNGVTVIGTFCLCRSSLHVNSHEGEIKSSRSPYRLVRAPCVLIKQ